MDTTRKAAEPKPFLQRLKEDFFHRELIPVKVLMFLIYGGQATLYPYFSVHLKSLGVGLEDTAVIFAVQPVIALLVAPLMGILADKIGNFKLMFCFFLLFSALTANLLQLVPAVEVETTVVPSSVECHGGSGLLILDLQDWCRVEHCENFEYTPDTVGDIAVNFCDSESEYCTPWGNDSFRFSVTNSTQCQDSSGQDAYVAVRVRYAKRNLDQFLCSASLNDSVQLVANGTVTCRVQLSAVKTFWTYLGIRLMVTLGIGMVNGLFDAASMAIIQNHDADVGFNRFWATFAMCALAPISGLLVDVVSENDENQNFGPCFYMYAGLYFTAGIVSCFVDLSMKVPSEKPFKNLKRLLTNSEVLLMLFNVAFLGICWGFLENYLFLFLENELHSSTLLMGLTVTVGSGTALPMTLVSTWLTKKLGYVNVMVVAFLAYAIRFVGYSFATDPYVCLVYEMMENFTFTLLTVGVTLYCAHLAPLEMLTTMMTLWNGLHLITGRAFGSLSGGFMTAHIGYRRTFRVFSYVCTCLGAFYLFVNLFYLRPRQKREAEDAKEEPDKPSEEEVYKRARALSLTTESNVFGDAPPIYPLNLESSGSFRSRRHSSEGSTRKTAPGSPEEMTQKKNSTFSLSLPASTDKILTEPASSEVMRNHLHQCLEGILNNGYVLRNAEPDTALELIVPASSSGSIQGQDNPSFQGEVESTNL